MRVIVARSKFFYQRLKPRAYSRSLNSYCIVAPAGECLYVNSVYENGGTKFPPTRSQELRAILPDLNKNPRTSMASSFPSEYLTKSEYLTPFLLQISAKFAIHWPAFVQLRRLIVNLRL